MGYFTFFYVNIIQYEVYETCKRGRRLAAAGVEV